MTVGEMHGTLGATRAIWRGRLLVAVVVRDARMNYGRPQYLVEPVAGVGSVWVEQLIDITPPKGA